MKMNKHKQSEFLCDAIEAARPHIPYTIETALSEVASGDPCVIVHRVNTFKPASNLARVTHRELLAVLSVTDENKLFIYNHSSDATGDEFLVFSSPLIHPEHFLAFSQ